MHRDQQVEGVDYSNKYTPVVSWWMVGLMLCLSISQGSHTYEVDFSNTFVQAFFDEEIYINLPVGFSGYNKEDQKEGEKPANHTDIRVAQVHHATKAVPVGFVAGTL